MADCCLTLVCSPSLQEKVFDALLEQPGIASFTSTGAAVHGEADASLSAAEQVLGLRRAVQVQVLLAAAERDVFRDLLRARFAGSGLQYWFTAVLEEGTLA